MSFTSTKIQRHNDSSDLWQTPPELYALLDNEFHFDAFDPCGPTPEGLREFDGLGKWEGKTLFLNPPYSNVEPWLKHAIEEQALGKTIIVLLRVDTSTDWFHDLVVPFAEVRYIRGRVAFVLANDYIDKNQKLHRKGERSRANFASMLAIYRGKRESA